VIDKVKIAQSFSRSANTYDSVAYLQRDVGCQLLESIDSLWLNKDNITQCLDLGCGTGYFQAALQARFNKANHIACDLAEGMLRHIEVLILYSPTLPCSGVKILRLSLLRLIAYYLWAVIFACRHLARKPCLN